MSANIETRNGRKSMFSVRQSVWHDPANATVIQDAPSYDDAVQLARLDYNVIKAPCKIVLPDGTLADSTKAFVTLRTDTNEELGAVGEQYEVVQNVDALGATLRPLVASGQLVLETAGVLGKGERAWMLASIAINEVHGKTREFLDENGVKPYALVACDHSGARGNLIAETLIRVVCQNTLNIAETQSNGIRVWHTGDALGKHVAAAQAIFGDLLARTAQSAAEFQALKETTLTPELFEAIVVQTVIGKHPTKRPDWNPEARMAEAVVNRYETKREALDLAWHYGTGHTGDDSAWEAYNGVVEQLDHNTELWPSRSGVYRTQALLTGTIRKAKESVLDRLVSFAEGRTTVDQILDRAEVDDGALLDGILARAS